MRIHSLFILKKTGACIYSRNFTDSFRNIEPNLITPFFSAIFSFSESVISKKTPEVLEMGGFRFVFKIYKEYIFAILSDSSASLLFVQSRLLSITVIFEEFIRSNEVDDYQEIHNANFDDQINRIISGQEEMRTSEPLYRKIVKLITNLVFENEILGAALFSINGNVIYSSLPQEILLSSLKELEIRHAVANEFSTTYYSLESGQKIFSKVIEIPWKLDPLILVVLFDTTTATGMAEVNLDKLSKKIQNII